MKVRLPELVLNHVDAIPVIESLLECVKGGFCGKSYRGWRGLGPADGDGLSALNPLFTEK